MDVIQLRSNTEPMAPTFCDIWSKKKCDKAGKKKRSTVQARATGDGERVSSAGSPLYRAWPHQQSSEFSYGEDRLVEPKSFPSLASRKVSLRESETQVMPASFEAPGTPPRKSASVHDEWNELHYSDYWLKLKISDAVKRLTNDSPLPPACPPRKFAARSPITGPLRKADVVLSAPPAIPPRMIDSKPQIPPPSIPPRKRDNETDRSIGKNHSQAGDADQSRISSNKLATPLQPTKIKAAAADKSEMIFNQYDQTLNPFSSQFIAPKEKHACDKKSLNSVVKSLNSVVQKDKVVESGVYSSEHASDTNVNFTFESICKAVVRGDRDSVLVSGLRASDLTKLKSKRAQARVVHTIIRQVEELYCSQFPTVREFAKANGRKCRKRHPVRRRLSKLFSRNSEENDVDYYSTFKPYYYCQTCDSILDDKYYCSCIH